MDVVDIAEKFVNGPELELPVFFVTIISEF